MTSNLSELKAFRNQLLSSVENDMMNADLLSQIEVMIDKTYLDRHNHEISYDEKNDNYRTVVDLPEGSGKRYKWMKCKRRQDLEKKLIKYYKETENKVTVQKLFSDWIEERMEHREIEPSTRDRMQTDFTRFFVSSGFASRCMDEITERELSTWIKGTITNHNLTKKAWANLRGLISGIFKYAKELGYTSISISYFLSDLVLPERMFRKTFRDPETEVFTDEELLLIINWIRDKDHPERMSSLSNLGILLCIFTGLRAGELSSLKYTDFSEKKMMVARTQTRHKEFNQYDYTVREETKGRDGRRYIAIPPVVHRIVAEIRKRNPNTEYLFISRVTGKLMTADTFSDKLERICKYVGIKVKRLHKIRKAYASMLLDAGVPEKIITNQMGHTDISTTRGYYYKDRHTDDEKVEAVINALEFPIHLIT